MSTQDSELDRYRALLGNADDEPKRLALIQLLIDEGARDKLAAKQQTALPELPAEPPPFVPLAPAHPSVSSRDAELLEGGESMAPDPLASGDVVSLISNLLSDKAPPPLSKPPAITLTTDIGDEFEKEIASLLKGLSRAGAANAPTRARIIAQKQAALESLPDPNKDRPG